MKDNLLRHAVLLSMLALIVILVSACGGNQAAPPEQPQQPAAQQEEAKQEEAPKSEEPAPTEEKKEFANKELNVAVFEGGYGKAYWEEVIKRFEADYPGVKVNLTSNPKIMDVIKPQLVAGNPPDFIYAPLTENTHTIQAMIKEKAFLELNDVFDSKTLDQDVPLKDVITDGMLEYAQPYKDGKIYYAPFYVSTLGLWYNQTLFEQKGWKAPETWDEFFALGETAKQEGRSLFTYQGIYPSYNESVVVPTIASFGGIEAIAKIENYEENAFKSDAVKQAFEIYNQIAQKGYLMPGTVALNHTQAQTEFLKGKALFIPNGNWFEGEMKDAPREEGFKFGFMAPPVKNAGDQRYAQTSFEGLYIPLKAKNPELAKEFLKYQYTEESVKSNAEKSMGVLAVKNGAELAKPYISESMYNSVKVFDNGVKPVLFQWTVTPKTEIIINDELYNPLNNIMNKKSTVDEWMDRVEKASAKLRDLMAKSSQ